ncbi:elongation of very long chain fatty acids protein-like [Daphnia pulicaria]|uniref:elongation of very long chain fatty acids protein-like n=1 Tax=Daphnia pulicaria TaxID=35523 RepID=UPI001EEC677F|nr:elongation of very long chain fatty acids protein-like [Daphnia pulicaria]XP_046644161.1 elongation of very long chain fatty acids protein-like [Daphnia pulicaria]
MFAAVKDFIDGYNDLMINRRDPRVDGWFLMSSFFPTMIICSCYIYFVKSLGPRLMRDRKPFELRSAIIIYNVIQVLASIYLVYKGLVHAWLFRYSLRCQPVDYSDDPEELIVAQMCWWYYFCKFTEFLDTVFFVLRKKFDQITNLHVIHHSIMPAVCWWGVKFAAGGHGTFFGMLNSFVHIIMYTYYLFSSMGPKYQKYLWWKKHLTSMQMIQFIAVFIHSAQLFFIDCNYPKILAYAMCFNALMFLSLFSNFYIQAYIKRRRLPTVKKEDDAANGKSKVTSHKAEKEKRGVGKMITNIMTNTSNACYIGQNGLYQSADKAKSSGSSSEKKKHM